MTPEEFDEDNEMEFDEGDTPEDYEREKQANIQLITYPVELPKFLWDDLDMRAEHLSIDRDALIRVILVERINR